MILEWFTRLPDRLRWVDLLAAAGIMVLFLVFQRVFTRYLFSFLMKKIGEGRGAAKWAAAFEKPLQYIFLLVGAYLAVVYYVPEQWAWMGVFNRLVRSIGIILAGWGIYNVSAASSVMLESISKKIGLDDASMLIPFLSKVIRFVVIVLMVTVVGGEWGFSINGLVAGMGLGSLAVALAAKETLGNILGGIVIITEKPFAKGDWIQTPSVEGIVEDITFRSTKIRTFAHSLVTVPNATLADQPITNWSRMGKRQITFSLKVALDTDRERLAAAQQRLERMLLEDDRIDPGTIIVRFRDFNDSNLGIFFYFFTKTTVWTEHLAVREEINLAVLRVLDEEGVSLAYPIQRLFIEEEDKRLEVAGA